MISAKKLLKLARKWQKFAAGGRKRINMPQTDCVLDANNCITTEKGHFVVYTIDKKRFVLPLDYLNKEIVRVLFNLAEEEFGLPSDGPLTLPCDAAFMEYVITLIKQHADKEVEQALLTSIAGSGRRCSITLDRHQGVANHQFSICSF